MVADGQSNRKLCGKSHLGTPVKGLPHSNPEIFCQELVNLAEN